MGDDLFKVKQLPSEVALGLDPDLMGQSPMFWGSLGLINGSQLW